jgi:hypothetical protein
LHALLLQAFRQQVGAFDLSHVSSSKLAKGPAAHCCQNSSPAD